MPLGETGGERLLALLIAAAVLLTLARQAFPLHRDTRRWLDRGATVLMLAALVVVLAIGWG